LSEPDLAAWIGRTQEREGVLDAWPAAALTAALGFDDPPGPGDPLPPFWHQLYLQPLVHAAATGADGHEEKGGFLPPVRLARRMWAGGRVRWHSPLAIGDRACRVSTVRNVTAKTGRHGPLVFVTVEHRLLRHGDVAVIEEHDIVYRDQAPAAASEAAAPSQAAWRRRWVPDEVLLFRYSALTYNGHRIHYDRRYATEIEGYPGLVVHGPLLATLMLDLIRRELPQARLRDFQFRARAPLFCGVPLDVLGEPSGSGARLWITGDDGRLAMTGEVGLA
jgi:3-methylfumaryl-CoA hydratase